MKITIRDSRPENPEPGDAWYDAPDYWPEQLIAPRHRGKRPLSVQVSDVHSFMIYSLASRDDRLHGEGWNVTGSIEAGDLTVTPSININEGRPDNWHGFITNGELRNA